MAGALMIFHQPLAVLYGLIVSCIICILVQNILLNKIINGKPDVLKALSTLLPPALIAFFIISDNNYVHWIALGLSIPALYFIYLRGNLNKFKLLFRS
jgi:hypothetical protein